LFFLLITMTGICHIAGHAYESNNHGHMAYLTSAEHGWLVGLQIAGAALYVVAFILNRKWRVHVNPTEGTTPSAAVQHPSGATQE
jgi:hypothetical protein